jgi:hypothetical protein
MRFSIFPKFGALNSKPVFDAFTEGAKKLKFQVTEHDLTADVYVIWSMLWQGRMSKNKEIWDHAKKNGKNIVVLEVGALDRGKTWKIGLNGVNGEGYFGHEKALVPNRNILLGVSLKDWNVRGQCIVICGQHSASYQWRNRPSPEIWLENLVTTIRKHTDRPIIFRPHPRDCQWVSKIKDKEIILRYPRQLAGTYDDFNFEETLSEAWCIVNPCSNTGILSIINGVPSFVDKDSLAYPVANIDYSTLESPIQPDRSKWFQKICHTEWTVEEIASGLPIYRLF